MLMITYKDFNYTQYILASSFETGFDYYVKCCETYKKKQDEQVKNRLWQLWLFEIKNGSKETDFDKYYEKRTTAKSKKLDSVTRKNEESRILDKFKDVGVIKNDSYKI